MLYNFLNTQKNSHLFALYGLGALQMVLYRYFIIGIPMDVIPLVETLLMCFLLLVNVSIVNLIVRKNQLSEGNLLVVFFWIVGGLCFPELYKDATVMIASSCMLFVVFQIMELYHMADGRKAFFDIAVFIFTASLFFLPSLLALILLWMQILIVPGKKFRNFLIPIVAFAMLFVILWAISLIFGWENQLFSAFYYVPNFDITLFLQYKYLPLLGMLLLNGMLASRRLRKTYKRYYTGFFISLMLVGLVGIVLHEAKNAVGWLYFSFPTALSGMMLIEGMKRNWLREVLLWSLIVALLSLFWVSRVYLL